MAEAAFFTKTWAVGSRYRVTLTAPKPVAGRMVTASCEWDPRMPKGMLREKEKADYIAGMAEAQAELAELLGHAYIRR